VSDLDAKDTEIARLRQRCALLDALLGEALRHKYIDDDKVSQTWLKEVREAVTDVEKFTDLNLNFDPEA
jgi:hypothetical protein